MSDVVIRAEGLGKKYLIGHQAQAERYTALRDVVARTAKGLVRSARDMLQGRQLVVGDEIEEFWALKDVNFEIKRGDVIGVIGRNGAGKSTLLKILSRITEPSTGRVEIKGRVASLLEVGTGFHPELSGRENIYLNGAILGMSRAEIKRKFDEIVDFAEVEKFLDTPVKHYSSGMYVRLAFAVAAHLEPEILVVDEVLAVGDAEFQKKCLGKMGEVAGAGRTVLFVSHNMAAIRALCEASILLQAGTLVSRGSTSAVLESYMASIKANSALKSSETRGPHDLFAWLDSSGTTQTTLSIGINLRIKVAGQYEVRAFLKGHNLEPVGVISAGGFGSSGVMLNSGSYDMYINADISFLAQGTYYIDVDIHKITSNERIKAPSSILFSHNPAPLLGETIPLKAEWGNGSVRLKTQLLLP